MQLGLRSFKNFEILHILKFSKLHPPPPTPTSTFYCPQRNLHAHVIMKNGYNACDNKESRKYCKVGIQKIID